MSNYRHELATATTPLGIDFDYHARPDDWMVPLAAAQQESAGSESLFATALFGVVNYSMSQKGYDKISPMVNEDTRPLLLDPARAYDGGVPAKIKIINELLPKRVHEIAQRAELTEFDLDRLLSEIQFEVSLRLDRNNQSMGRLRDALQAAPFVDDTMLDIVHRARGGRANMDEMVRLIKEYPEMISLEAFKFTKPLDWTAATQVDTVLDAHVARLTKTFHDAEVTPYPNGSAKLLKKPFFDKNGMLVVKHIIGEIKSEDSYTELVRKHTYILFDQPNYPANVPPRMLELSTQDGPRLMNVQPISTTAYFRARDYKKRKGYIAPAGEIEAEIGSLNGEADHHRALCAAIGDAAYRGAYMEAATKMRVKMEQEYQERLWRKKAYLTIGRVTDESFAGLPRATEPRQ